MFEAQSIRLGDQRITVEREAVQKCWGDLVVVGLGYAQRRLDERDVRALVKRVGIPCVEPNIRDFLARRTGITTLMVPAGHV